MMPPKSSHQSTKPSLFVVAQLAAPALPYGTLTPTRRKCLAHAFPSLCRGAALLRPISATCKPSFAFPNQNNPIEIKRRPRQSNFPRQILNVVVSYHVSTHSTRLHSSLTQHQTAQKPCNVSPLESALTKTSASADSKRLTKSLSPSNATLAKNRGEGGNPKNLALLLLPTLRSLHAF